MIYIELVPTDISSFEWPMGKKEVLSKNAIECKEREVADDWWSFYCDGHKFYDSEDPKEPTTEDKVTRLPWDYYSVQRFWNLNTRVGKERAVDMTTELMKKYSNLSVHFVIFKYFMLLKINVGLCPLNRNTTRKGTSPRLIKTLESSFTPFADSLIRRNSHQLLELLHN